MATTWYHTVKGEIIAETTSGSRTSYLTDALGSVTAMQNAAGTTTATWRYKPYGSLLVKTGAGPDPRFLWLGAIGYRLGVTVASCYVRARHIDSNRATWATVDALWPVEPPFVYVHGNPTSKTDSRGSSEDFSTLPGIKPCRCAQVGVTITKPQVGACELVSVVAGGTTYYKLKAYVYVKMTGVLICPGNQKGTPAFWQWKKGQEWFNGHLQHDIKEYTPDNDALCWNKTPSVLRAKDPLKLEYYGQDTPGYISLTRALEAEWRACNEHAVDYAWNTKAGDYAYYTNSHFPIKVSRQYRTACQIPKGSIPKDPPAGSTPWRYGLIIELVRKGGLMSAKCHLS